MQFNDIIVDSRLITLKGDGGSGKLTFSLWLVKNILNENVTVFSSLNEIVFIKKLNVIRKSFSEFKNISSFCENFSLKNNWKEIKDRYSFQLFLEELENLIKNSKSENIIFHRFSGFFESNDLNDIEEFINKILKISQKYNKRVFILLNRENPIYEVVEEILFEYNDIIFSTTNTKKSYKNIEITYSLYPIDQKNYTFIRNNNILKLEEESLTQEILTQKNILLVTQNPYIKKLHNYIFKNFDWASLKTVENSLEIVDEILKEPHLTIYNINDKNFNFKACNIAKEHNLNTSILILTEKDFIRVEDKTDAYDNGCKEILTIKNLNEYIFSLEKILDFTFYHKNKFETEDNLFTNKNRFINTVKMLIDQNQFFTIFKFKVEDKIDVKSIAKKMRKYDIAYYNKKEKTLYLLVLNMQKSNLDIIKTKLFNEIKNLHFISSVDSLDIYFDKVNIFQ